MNKRIFIHDCSMAEKILIVEDQFAEANDLRIILENAGYNVCKIARSVPIALEVIAADHPDFVLLDIFLKGSLTGLDLAVTLKEKGIPFVFLSANSNKEILEQAKKTHPNGFLVKPFRERDVLVTLEIARYTHANSLDSLMRKHKDEASPKNSFLEKNIIGESERLLEVLDLMNVVSPTDATVLIYGESGTGKERIVDCIHELSLRKTGPLIKVNCGGLPPTLIESTLFGHEKGSFTGATERRIGKFEQAHGGTIFLDEIGEMSADLQVKLLRVIQEKEIERVGGRAPIKVDIRVVAATNKNLEKEVAEGKFRMDLYYRLNVFPLSIPALRERKEDIPILVNHFIKLYSQRLTKSITGVSNDFLKMLSDYSWPGNIRELEHFIQRAILMSKDEVLNDLKLPLLQADDSITTHSSGNKTMEENERDYILATLKKCKHRVRGAGGAAELLNLPPTTLYSKMKKLGIARSDSGNRTFISE